MSKIIEQTVKSLAQAIYAKKGENIIGIDVRGISSLSDYILIASGNVDRHVIALCREVEREMLKGKQKPAFVEGKQSGDWIIIDFFEIMIHLLVPEMREKYQLERLWPDGKLIELGLEKSKG